MGQTYADRVKETATCSGTSNPYTLGGAETSYRPVSSKFANGAVCSFCAVGRTSGAWETGLGTYNSSGNTLARTTIYDSSNSGSAVNWTSETIDIFHTETSVQLNNTPVNLTSASSDYALSVGETAYLTFSGATSVPLHIATAQGVYELSVVGDTTVSPSAGAIALVPNAGGFSGTTFFCPCLYTTSSLSAGASGSETPQAYQFVGTGFTIGNYLNIQSESKINTFTKAKSVKTSQYGIESDGVTMQYQESMGYWKDTSTAWTSLGTVTFAFAQSGTITIKRIL